MEIQAKAHLAEITGMVEYHLQSSVKICNASGSLGAKEVVYIPKRRGPSTKFWGTPWRGNGILTFLLAMAH